MTGAFADSCRDFTARSTKDIGHVEIHYADGRMEKDESIDGPAFSIDGGEGEEIDFAIVKSGTTAEAFDCQAARAPAAALEARTGPDSWTSAEYNDAWDPPDSQTLTFRGTSSTDPNNDIASWSLDFGDGTSASGSWGTDPPMEISHTYPDGGLFTVVLIVTDSAGQSGSDSMDIAVDNDDGFD